ncbi:6-phosphofructokinase isozyme 1 [compost metagenome]
MDAKVCILGHQQRGGSPTAADRILASRMGAAAVDALLKGYCDIMIGTEGERLVQVPLDLVAKHERKTQIDLLSLANILAT